jgi:hypothetical protein
LFRWSATTLTKSGSVPKKFWSNRVESTVFLTKWTLRSLRAQDPLQLERKCSLLATLVLSLLKPLRKGRLARQQLRQRAPPKVRKPLMCWHSENLKLPKQHCHPL